MTEDPQVYIIPIQDKAAQKKVLAAARENGEGVLDATHAVIRNGDIIGAISLSVNCSSVWMHKEKVKARDSASILQCLDTLMLDRGITSYLMPCEEKSPYYRVMDKLGFQRVLGNWSLFIRDLRKAHVLLESD